MKTRSGTSYKGDVKASPANKEQEPKPAPKSSARGKGKTQVKEAVPPIKRSKKVDESPEEVPSESLEPVKRLRGKAKNAVAEPVAQVEEGPTKKKESRMRSKAKAEEPEEKAIEPVTKVEPKRSERTAKSRSKPQEPEEKTAEEVPQIVPKAINKRERVVRNKAKAEESEEKVEPEEKAEEPEKAMDIVVQEESKTTNKRERAVRRKAKTEELEEKAVKPEETAVEPMAQLEAKTKRSERVTKSKSKVAEQDVKKIEEKEIESVPNVEPKQTRSERAAKSRSKPQEAEEKTVETVPQIQPKRSERVNKLKSQETEAKAEQIEPKITNKREKVVKNKSKAEESAEITVEPEEKVEELEEKVQEPEKLMDIVVQDEPMTATDSEGATNTESKVEEPMEKVPEKMDEELEPMVVEQTQNEVEVEAIPVKRKIDESPEEVPSEPTFEPIKRLRVSRFSVPSIPPTCGQLYSFGDDIAGELGFRLKQYKESKLKRNEPSFVTDSDGQPIDNIVSVVCGAIHSCCLTFEGKVLTFGCNDDSALGRDTQTNSDETEDSIEIDDSEEKVAKTPKTVSGLPEVVKITAGDMHTCVMTREGAVYIWGNFKDESKKLGLFVDCLKDEESDDFNATQLPRKVELEAKIVDIASGCHHILLLTEDGDVLSFGDGSIGQLGRIAEDQLGSVANDRKLFLEPKKIEFGENVVIEKIWANQWSSYAKTTSGDILCWGLNNNNQLGFKSETSIRIPNPDPNQSQAFHERILELRPKKADKMPANVVMIANGQHHMLALDADGNVFACGCNLYGKLGLAVQDPAESPQLISREAFDGQKVSSIACGEFCSLAITESGHLMTWGQGALQIGVVAEDGNFPDLLVPTRLRGLLADETRFVGVASGSQHTLVIGNKSSINGN